MAEMVFTVTLKADTEISPKSIEDMEEAIQRRIARGGFFYDVDVQYSHRILDEKELNTHQEEVMKLGENLGIHVKYVK